MVPGAGSGDQLHDPDEAEQLVGDVVCGHVRGEGAVGGGSLDGFAAHGINHIRWIANDTGARHRSGARVRWCAFA